MHFAQEPLGRRAHPVQSQTRGRFRPQVRPCRLALGIIGVGRESEADGSGIALFRGRKILRQPRVFAHQQRQHAGGHGVQRTQMPDRSLSCDLAQPVHHVVAGDSFWFVDDKKPVHIITLALRITLANCASHAPI